MANQACILLLNHTGSDRELSCEKEDDFHSSFC